MVDYHPLKAGKIRVVRETRGAAQAWNEGGLPSEVHV